MKAALILGTALGGVFALFALLVQVPPEVAVSNLQAWAEFVGVEKVPSWIGTAKADQIATVISIVGAILSFLFVAVIYRRRRQVVGSGYAASRVLHPVSSTIAPLPAASAKIAGYERLISEGQRLLNESISSETECEHWKCRLETWRRTAEDFVRRQDGHSAAGHFKRGLGLYVSLSLKDSFNGEHDGGRTVLAHNLEDLTKRLEWAQDKLPGNSLSGSSFSHWNGVDNFTLLEAASLWAEIDPPPLILGELQKHPKGRARYQMLTEAIECGELEVHHPFDPKQPRTIVVTAPGEHTPHMIVDREDLRRLAASKGERPSFLYSSVSSAKAGTTSRATSGKIEALRGRATFDYSTHSGSLSVGEGDCLFRLAFSKASDTFIYMMSRDHTGHSNLKRLARAKGIRAGERVNIDRFDSTSSNYSIRTGEHFLAENDKGYFMQGKIVSIKDDSRGADHDEIVFEYEINSDGGAEFTAL